MNPSRLQAALAICAIARFAPPIPLADEALERAEAWAWEPSVLAELLDAARPIADYNCHAAKAAASALEAVRYLAQGTPGADRAAMTELGNVVALVVAGLLQRHPRRCAGLPSQEWYHDATAAGARKLCGELAQRHLPRAARTACRVAIDAWQAGRKTPLDWAADGIDLGDPS